MNPRICISLVAPVALAGAVAWLMTGAVVGPQQPRYARLRTPTTRSGSADDSVATAAALGAKLTALTLKARTGHAGPLPALRRQLVALSRRRAEALGQVIQRDPARAVGAVLPGAIRASLSELPGAQVESRVALSGFYGIWHQDDFSNPRDGVYLQRLVSPDGRSAVTLRGVSASLSPGERISLTGYRLGDQVLVTPGGVRTSRARRKHRPRGRRASIAAATSTSTSSPPTTGAINVAVIAVNFSDSTTPVNMSAIQTVFGGSPGADAEDYFKEASYGKAWIAPSFYGPYTINATSSAECSSSHLSTDMMNAANPYITFVNFSRIVFVPNCPDGLSAAWNGPIWTPQGTITANGIELTPHDAQLLDPVVHELSHTLGNWDHAGYFDCVPDAFEPPDRFDPGCTSPDEYGDEFDVLGWPPSQSLAGHLDPRHKAHAGWFDSTQFPTVSSPGTYTYTLAAYESGGEQPLALNIPRGDSGTAFTVEYRQPIGFDAWMGSSTWCPHCTVTQGASIRLDYYMSGTGPGSDTQLIDTTPGSIPDSILAPSQDGHDGALLPGRTFTDPEYGITITTESATASGLTVQVSIPTQTCTHSAPTVSAVTPSSQTVAPGQTATYSFTVTNNDSAGCPANTFRYTSDTGQDITSVASPDYFTLAPGASATVSLAVKSLPTTLDGTYSYTPGAGRVWSNSLGIAAVPVSLTCVLASPADTTAPSMPTGLTATVLGSDAARLTWTASSDDLGVVGYRILSNGSIYTTTATSFTATGLSPATTYTISVQALDQQGNLSPAAGVTVTTPSKTDYTPPSRPAVSATATDHSITVSWTPGTDNVGVAYYGVRPCLVRSCYLPADTTSFTASGLSSRTENQITIIAYDGSGNYAAAPVAIIYTAVAGDASAPTQPQRLVPTSAAAGQLHLSWQASSDPAGIARYDVYRNGRKIGSSSSTTYTDATSGSGSSNDYYVQALDPAGSLSAPSPALHNVYIPRSGSLDSTAPTASITSPATGAGVSGAIPIDVSASDDVGVSRVQLYVDGALYGTSYSSPYSFPLDTTLLSSGSHWLYACAYDEASNYGCSPITNVTVGGSGADTTPPTVSLTAPAGGTTVSGSVAITASASDNVGVASVALAVDGITMATPTSAPYSTSWNTTAVPNGTHTITATGKDAAGNLASTSVTVTVSNITLDTTPPTVSITAPANGATASGSVTIAGSASDDVAVASVAVAVDGTTLATITPSSTPLSTLTTLTTTSYTTSWNTTTVANGTHTITATAKDPAGNAASTSVTVSVYNAPPDTKPPTVPSGLSVKALSASQMAVSWNPSTDDVAVTGYDVFRNGALLTTVTGTHVVDSGLAMATAYSYQVRARDGAGNVSALTGAVKTATTSTRTTGALSGWVISKATGQPLKGAKVTATLNGHSWSANTNASGFYLLANLAPGTYSVSIAETGYSTQTTTLAVTANTATIDSTAL